MLEQHDVPLADEIDRLAPKKRGRWPVRTLSQRFADHTIPEPNSGCLLWIGSITRKGYGQIRIGGRNFIATRVSLELDGRPVPVGMCALHRCDNSFCVNPGHLFVGTLSDNTQDMMRKGRWSKPPRSICPTDRHARGSKHPQSKMTEDQARTVKMRIAGGARVRTLAREMGLSREQVRFIAKGKTWTHV